VNTTPERFEAILDQCLSQIVAGKARVTSALVSYPAMADELEPLLLAAEWVRALPREDLTPEAKARIETLLLKKAGRRWQIRLPAWKRPVLRPAWGWAATRAVLALLVVVLVGALVIASARALPGEPWYRVKLAAEDVWLWLVPPQSKPGLHVRYARHRLDELQALLERGQFDPTVAEAVGVHLDAALEGTQDLPATAALAVLNEVLALNAREDRMLAQLPAGTAGISSRWLAAARQAAAARTQRARALIADLGGGGTAVPSATATLLAGTITPASQAQTGTPQPTGLTGSPEAAPASATPELPAGSSTPQPTSSPEPAGPGDTPVPEEAGDTPAPPAPPDTPAPSGPTDTPAPPAPTNTPAPSGPTDTPAPPAPTNTPLPPPPTNTPPPPPPTDTPAPPPTDTPAPPPPTDTPGPVPPGQTKTPEPPGQTKTPEPPGQTKTPSPGREP
jgi:hypothetical protein